MQKTSLPREQNKNKLLQLFIKKPKGYLLDMMRHFSDMAN